MIPIQGSIPGWGTKIPHAEQHSQKLKKKKKARSYIDCDMPSSCMHAVNGKSSGPFSGIFCYFSSQRPKAKIPGHSFCHLSSQWEPAQLLLCCCSGWYDNIPGAGKHSPPTQHCSYTRQEAPPLGAKSLKGQKRWASPESEPSPTPHSAHAGPKIPCPLPGSAQACSLPVSLPQTPGTSKGQLFAGHVDRVGMSIYICICICICLGFTWGPQPCGKEQNWG